MWNKLESNNLLYLKCKYKYKDLISFWLLAHIMNLPVLPLHSKLSEFNQIEIQISLSSSTIWTPSMLLYRIKKGFMWPAYYIHSYQVSILCSLSWKLWCNIMSDGPHNCVINNGSIKLSLCMLQVCRIVSPRGPISCTRTYFLNRDFINPFQGKLYQPLPR